MIYGHTVIKDGVLYGAGNEVPEKGTSKTATKTTEKAEKPKPTKSKE